MYLYSPQSIPTVKCQLSIFRTDRTRRSMWPDASGRWQRSIWKSRALSDQTRRRVWSGVTGRVRSLKTLSGTILYFDRTRPQWRPVTNPSSPDCRACHLRVRLGEPQRSVVMLHFALVHYTDWTRPVKIETASSQEEMAQITLDRDTTWTKLLPNDLWASPELPSAKFDKCSPNLNK
jgi:hypothetical protein